jgi:hypothetical protein
MCRVEVEELEAMVQALPKNVTIIGKTTGRWEVRVHMRRKAGREGDRRDDEQEETVVGAVYLRHHC